MDRNELLGQLAKLGFPLFGPQEALDANKVLAEVVKSSDARLWEGFPVVLAKSAEKGLFNYGLANEYIEEPSQKTLFSALINMSLALYDVLELKFSWAKGLNHSERDVTCYREYLNQNNEFKLGNTTMTSERLKATFNNYFLERESNLSDLFSVKEEAALEYALSQVFSLKQKELFFKKLKSEKMTKTEREYFYRVVKKKLVALGNEQLHGLARKALGL